VEGEGQEDWHAAAFALRAGHEGLARGVYEVAGSAGDDIIRAQRVAAGRGRFGVGRVEVEFSDEGVAGAGMLGGDFALEWPGNREVRGAGCARYIGVARIVNADVVCIVIQVAGRLAAAPAAEVSRVEEGVSVGAEAGDVCIVVPVVCELQRAGGLGGGD